MVYQKLQPKAVFIGDSITVGGCAAKRDSHWAASVSNSLHLKEINLGISGMTAHRYDETKIPICGRTYKYLFVAFGANDIGANTLPVDTFVSDLKKIIRKANANYWYPHDIIVISPYYSSQEGRNQYLRFGIKTAADSNRVMQFFNASKMVADDMGCRFVDVYTPMQESKRVLLFDGLHPNQRGHDLIASVILSTLKNQ